MFASFSTFANILNWPTNFDKYPKDVISRKLILREYLGSMLTGRREKATIPSSQLLC
jgi:hypothetical protein